MITRLRTHIEEAIQEPGMSETRQSQLRLASILIPFGAVFNILMSVYFIAIGFVGVGISWITLAVVFLLCFAAMFTLPGRYTLFLVVNMIAICISNIAAHATSGGYTGGAEFFIWILAVPVYSALFAEKRVVPFLATTFLLSVVAATLLEPWAELHMPQVAPPLVTLQASINYLMLGLQLAGAGFYLFTQIEHYRERADSLLLNILPLSIAARLKENPQTIADGYDDVTVLFADIVDFTTMSANADPVDVVGKLNAIFSDFDTLAERHGLEKIKTIGDAYMVAGGLPEPRPGHCQAVAAFAVEMLETLDRHSSWTGEPIRLRVGINCGPVVAGVIGRQKFIYDLWGDAVNVASRMESNGLSNQIQVTEVVRDRLEGQYRFEERGPIDVKGKGQMTTYLLSPA